MGGQNWKMVYKKNMTARGFENQLFSSFRFQFPYLVCSHSFVYYRVLVSQIVILGLIW